jgi:LuxR family transcriptional regulator
MATMTRPTLTPAQLAVLRCIRDGMTDREIAEESDRSEKTVKVLVARARGRLGAKNRTHAVVIAIRTGLIGIGR